MSVKVSVKKQTFYDDYIEYDSLPDDLVAVDDTTHLEMVRAMNEEGKRIIKTEEGVTLSSAPPSRFHKWDDEQKGWVLTEDSEKNLSQEVSQKNKQTVTEKIDEAVTYINRKQWSGKASLGRLDEIEQALYGEWLDYIDALNEVDTDSDSEMVLPEPPEQ